MQPADACCGVAGRRDASGAFASCRSINSRSFFSSSSDHLPASPLQPFSAPLPGPLQTFFWSSWPFSGCRPAPRPGLSSTFPDPSRPSSSPEGRKKEVAPLVQPPLSGPNPRLDFASLVFSLLLAAGALSKVHLAARVSIRHEKTACKLLCGGFSLTSRVLRPWTFEPNPRLELGTPSLRVKCSTTELIRPARTLA